MTKLIEREGDLFTTEAKAIGHGVNCVGVMGAGIAKTFRDRFPTMYNSYRWRCSRDLLSAGDVMIWHGDEDLYVFNIASQYLPGADAKIFWLAQGVIGAVLHCEALGLPVLALPYIGAGIGGLEPENVKHWLTEIAEAGPTDIELWTYKG